MRLLSSDQHCIGSSGEGLGIDAEFAREVPNGLYHKCTLTPFIKDFAQPEHCSSSSTCPFRLV